MCGHRVVTPFSIELELSVVSRIVFRAEVFQSTLANQRCQLPTRNATVAEFAAIWRIEVVSKCKPSATCSANSHLNSHIIPRLGKLRVDQIGVGNQQIFVNQLVGASRKTVLNILSTLMSL